jgi:hypothetical protein
MDRRDVLRYLGLTALAPLVEPLSPAARWDLGERLHRATDGARQAGRALSTPQMAEVRALADTILPRTDTPGALDVRAPEFVDLLLAEWYPDNERRQLLAGLDALTARCRAARGKALAELDAAGRAAFVGTVDGTPGDPATAEWSYARLKDGIVFAWLTSEPIARIASPLPVIPGRFDGCVPA